jgi:hypothetical protein
MYLEHLDEDEEIPFSLGTADPVESPGHGAGPSVRENVDTGASVLDISAMRAELEEARRVRKGGS